MKFLCSTRCIRSTFVAFLFCNACVCFLLLRSHGLSLSTSTPPRSRASSSLSPSPLASSAPENKEAISDGELQKTADVKASEFATKVSEEASAMPQWAARIYADTEHDSPRLSENEKKVEMVKLENLVAKGFISRSEKNSLEHRVEQGERGIGIVDVGILLVFRIEKKNE